MSVMKYKNPSTGLWEPLTAVKVLTEVDYIGGSVTGIPSDIVSEAERVVSSIKTKQAANSITFIAVSDSHELADDDSSATATQELTRRGNKNAGQGARVIADRLSPDFFCHLGDFVFGGSATTEAGAMSAIARVREYYGALSTTLETFYTPGNHDGLHYSNVYLDYGTISDMIGTYRYVDFADKKVRVICLNTADNSADETAYQHIGGTQLQWFCEALDLSAKSDAADWGVIILSHHPLDWADVSVAADVIAAYESGGSYARTQDGVAVSKDFAGKNTAKLIASFHGHVHGFKVDTVTGTSLKRLAIPNTYFYRNNEYGENGSADSNGIEFGETTTYSKVDNGTGKNTAFCVVTIDLDREIIYADCFGAGYDRVVSYGGEVIATYSVTNNLTNATNSNGTATVTEGSSYSASITANSGYELSSIKVTMGGTDITASTVSGSNITIASVTGDVVITVTTVAAVVPPSYTNLVPASIDTDGSIYNGTGYKEGYRLNSSGVPAELAGAVHSGFIPYDGEVIRAWGTTSANASNSGNYIGLYDASFEKIYMIGGSNYTNYGGIWEAKDGKYMVTFDPAVCTNEALNNYLASAKYIRVSWAVGTGANLVVTLDEEIT